MADEYYVPDDKKVGDVVSGGMVVQLAPHHEVHEGEYYQASAIFRALSDNAFRVMAFRVGSKPVHLTWGMDLGGQTEWFIREGIALSASGTSGPVFNLNRTKPDNAEERFFDGVTMSASGTLLASGLLAAGSNKGNQSGGGGLSRTGVERIFAPNTWYALVLKNTSGGAINGSVEFEYYTAEVS